jgi:hypothetical protein
MGEVVNLRLQRKRAARRAADATAVDQRLLHGLPKSLRQTARRESETSVARLEAHRLDKSAVETAANAGGDADPLEAGGRTGSEDETP